MVAVTLAVEGPTDAAVLRRVLAAAGVRYENVYIQNGKTNLDRNLRGFNFAARHAPWLVLRDLDNDETCAPTLVARLLPEPAAHMRFRIAMRKTEAWLLADGDSLARFLAVSPAAMPRTPEQLTDPKAELVRLARRSRSRAIREDIVPATGWARSVGPGYTSRVIEFVEKLWRPDAAADRADSLARCLRVLRDWTAAT